RIGPVHGLDSAFTAAPSSARTGFRPLVVAIPAASLPSEVEDAARGARGARPAKRYSSIPSNSDFSGSVVSVIRFSTTIGHASPAVRLKHRGQPTAAAR